MHPRDLDLSAVCKDITHDHPADLKAATLRVNVSEDFARNGDLAVGGSENIPHDLARDLHVGMGLDMEVAHDQVSDDTGPHGDISHVIPLGEGCAAGDMNMGIAHHHVEISILPRFHALAVNDDGVLRRESPACTLRSSGWTGRGLGGGAFGLFGT